MKTNHTKDECCKKCANGAGRYALAIARPYCLNSNCTCHHTKNIQDVADEILEDLGLAKNEATRSRIRPTLTQHHQDMMNEVVEAERVLVCSPQWVKDDPAWLCLLVKENKVLKEKVCTKTELSGAYFQATGTYASPVITVEQSNIGAKHILQTLTRE